MQVLPQRNFVFLFIATLVAFLGISSVVWGQTTVGPNDAGTGTNVTGVGNVSWTNTGNIASASTTDNARVILQNNSSNYLKGSNYGFNIPPGAIINGITVDIAKLRESGAGNEIFDTSVRLVKNGSIIGSNHADPNNWTRDQGTPAVVSYGGNSDLWGATWTAADINATNFGVVIAAREPQNRNLDADVYYMRVSVTYTTTSSPSNYCTSYGNRTDGYTTGIRLVNFNTINNPTPDEDNDYSDFTAISTTLTKGLSYNLTVNVNTDGNYTNYSYAWIDWNQDGDFNDSGESFNLGTATNVNNGGTSLSPLSITIPPTASVGSTRMRVSTKYFSNPNACETGFDGEVEDYTINVIPAISITTGTISPISYCSGTPVSIPYSITGTYNPGNVFSAQLSNATGSFAAPVNIGTLTLTTAGTISGTIPVSTASGNAYRIRVVSNNPVITGTDNGINLTVNAAPTAPTVGTITQPTCTTATGSVVLNGLPSGSWKLTRSPGSITTTGTGTSTTISNLSPGTYTYTVIGSNNGTGLKADYFNNMTLSGPVALTRTDATVNYDWGNGNPGSPIGNDNFSVRWSGQIQPLYSENYTFKTNSDDGIRLWVNGTQIINNWTNHGPTLNTGNISLTAGVKYDIVLEFYENSGGAVAQLSWSSTNSQVDQIIPQSQLYPIAGSCSSAPSANVVINAQPTTPTAPTVGTITQPTCTSATGSVVLNGLPSGNWTINPGAITGSGANKTITGLVAGTYNYTVTNANGCISSSSSANVLINAQPTTPTAPTLGTITQPTCSTATGSVVLSGLPSGNWTLTRSPGNITTTGNVASTTISGLTAGTYTYKVTNASGCISSSSANVLINAQPTTPTAPTLGTITQPTCSTATGSVVLSGLPSGNWTLTRSPGNITTTGNIASSTISGLAAGTYTYKVTNASGCISSSTANVVINAQPSTPTAVLTGSATICEGESTDLTLNITGQGPWDISGTINGNPFTTNITGSPFFLPVNPNITTTYSISSATGANGCTNNSINSSVTITVLPALQNNSISQDQTICDGFGPQTLTGTNVSGGDGTYSYLWENSTTSNSAGFNPAAGTNNTPDYDPGSLSQTSWFRRTVTSASCAGNSNVVKITLNPPIINNQLNFTNGISGTLCGTANENGVVNLSAPAETVFNYVNFASYGTPGGTCGNFTINSSCHALTSQDVSETNLLGKNTANIPATNGVYGDPCVGTVKKLNVQASYSQPICNGTAPGAISGTLPTGGDGSYTYLWESSTSGPNSGFIPATGSNTLQNYSPGVLTQTSWFKRTVTSSNCSNESPVILISVKQDNIWTGATDTDWNTASNWACNSIPSFNTNVVINGGLTNYPILNTGVLGMAKDIQINSVDSLTIIDNTLQIAGSIANSGTINSINGSVAFVGTVAQTMPATIFSANRIRNLIINNTADVSSSGNLEITGFLRVENGNFNTGNTLTLISNATQTALIDGSGNGQVVGTVKMQRHLYPEAFGYKYFSSPFSNTSVGDFSSYVDLNATFPNFYIYDENREDADSNDATGWIAYTTAIDPLDILKGYALNFGDTLASPKTVEIFGTVNNGNKQITLYNNDRLYTKGFNLVGNPYPSPIDWNAATGWTKTNIDDALYFFTAGNTNMYTGTYTSYVNGIQSSDGLSSNIIPSMQGFFVHVSDGPSKVTATLGVTNSVRTNNYTQGFLKVREPEKAALIRITASFENEVNTDPAVIYFPHFAELSFEKDKDALKLMNTDIRVPNLYSLTPENKKLSINALPKPGSSDVKKIPLGLKTEKEGWMLIGLKDLENLPSNFNVYLIDSEKRIGQNLSRKPQYRFYAKSGQQDSRFHLMFSETELSDPAIAFDEPFSVRTLGGKVMVRLNLEPGESGVLLASTVTGQILDRKNVSDKEIIEIEGIKSSGVYFFSINLKDGIFSKKVLIQK